MKKLTLLSAVLFGATSIGLSVGVFAQDPVGPVVDGTTKTMQKAGQGAVDAAHHVGKATNNAVKGAVHAVKATGQAVHDTGKATKDMVSGKKQ